MSKEQAKRRMMPGDELPAISTIAREAMEAHNHNEEAARHHLYEQQRRDQAVRQVLVDAGIDAAFRALRTKDREAAQHILTKELTQADKAKAAAFYAKLCKKGQNPLELGDPLARRRAMESAAIWRARQFLNCPLFGGGATFYDATREMLVESRRHYVKQQDAATVQIQIHDRMIPVPPDDVTTLGNCLEMPQLQPNLLAALHKLGLR